MPEFKLNPATTAAVILGASEFPRAQLPLSRAFHYSAEAFLDYLGNSEHGLGLPDDHITWLFDDGRGPADLLEHVANFLDRRNADSEGGLRDFVLYYVGHGLFTAEDRAYCLALRCTNAYSTGSTSMRGSDLAHILKENAPFVRRFVVLDCCFAASIFKELQAAPLEAAKTQLMEELPDRGTALLCASSAREVAIAPTAQRYTMFSGAMLKVLSQGEERCGPKLSFSDVGHLIQKRLHRDFPSSYVRPQVLLPDERYGDISTLPLFPNPAYHVSGSLLPDAGRFVASTEAEKGESRLPQNTAEDRPSRTLFGAGNQSELEGVASKSAGEQQETQLPGGNSAEQPSAAPDDRPPQVETRLFKANCEQHESRLPQSTTKECPTTTPLNEASQSSEPAFPSNPFELHPRPTPKFNVPARTKPETVIPTIIAIVLIVTGLLSWITSDTTSNPPKQRPSEQHEEQTGSSESTASVPTIDSPSPSPTVDKGSSSVRQETTRKRPRPVVVPSLALDVGEKPSPSNNLDPKYKAAEELLESYKFRVPPVLPQATNAPKSVCTDRDGFETPDKSKFSIRFDGADLVISDQTGGCGGTFHRVTAPSEMWQGKFICHSAPDRIHDILENLILLPTSSCDDIRTNVIWLFFHRTFHIPLIAHPKGFRGN